MYPILVYVLLVSPLPKFQSVLLYDKQFSRCRPFWDWCTNWPQNDLEPNKVNVPHICYQCLWVSSYSILFSLRPAVFELQEILRKVHQKTQNDLEPYKVTGIPYMCYQYPQAPNCTHFQSSTKRFWETGHFEKVHRMTPNWLWTLQGQMYHINMLLVSMSRKFNSVSLYDQPFLRQAIFETSALNDPKWSWTLQCQRRGQRYSIFVLLMSQSPKFNPIFLYDYDQPFSKYKVVDKRKCTKWLQNDLAVKTVKSTLYILNANPQRSNNRQHWKCTEWPQNDLEHLTIKNTVYVISTYPREPNFRSLCSTTIRFQNTRLVKIRNYGNVSNDLRLILKS